MDMNEYSYVTLRQVPELKEPAAAWFHAKWGVPQEAYLECMESYLKNETEYGWYLCLDGELIIGGLGVIENDFHNRKDLSPNVCALYTEEDYRCQGIAKKLIGIVDKLVINDLFVLANSNTIDFFKHLGFKLLDDYKMIKAKVIKKRFNN